MNMEYDMIDSFVIYICLEGGFNIIYRKNETEGVKKGDTILLPADLKHVKLMPEKDSRLLEVYIEGTKMPDLSDELLDRLL
jgi:mannose-6-phosphate isomerase